MTDIDQRRIGELFALLGEERLLSLGAQLTAALEGLASLPADQLPEMLHRLSGSAASLGLPGIAAELAAAEHGGTDPTTFARYAAVIAPALVAAIHGSTHQR